MFDTLSGRLKYQYIKRDSDLNYSNDPPVVGANDPNYLLPYTSAFDMQNTRPTRSSCTSTGSRCRYWACPSRATGSSRNYNDVTLGRTDNDRQGYFLSANWGDPDK